jgi:hypothetical protein
MSLDYKLREASRFSQHVKYLLTDLNDVVRESELIFIHFKVSLLNE